MPKPKRASLTKISALLDGALRRHGVAKQVTAALIVEGANRVLDELLAGSALRHDVWAMSFDRGTLVIGCRSAAAAYDLDGMTKEIMDKIPEEVPEADVRSIVARMQVERGRF